MNTARKLKFDGFAAGERIRAFDFRPGEGRRDRYVEGTITDVNADGTGDAPFAHYVIVVDKDTGHPEEYTRVGAKVFVPFEVSFLEYDNRVTRID